MANPDLKPTTIMPDTIDLVCEEAIFGKYKAQCSSIELTSTGIMIYDLCGKAKTGPKLFDANITRSNITKIRMSYPADDQTRYMFLQIDSNAAVEIALAIGINHIRLCNNGMVYFRFKPENPTHQQYIKHYMEITGNRNYKFHRKSKLDVQLMSYNAAAGNI